jgi:hypothetical protein
MRLHIGSGQRTVLPLVTFFVPTKSGIVWPRPDLGVGMTPNNACFEFGFLALNCNFCAELLVVWCTGWWIYCILNKYKYTEVTRRTEWTQVT